MVLKLIQPIKGYFEELYNEILAEFLSEFVHVEVALPFVEGEIFGENVEEGDKVFIIFGFIFGDEWLVEIFLYFLHELDAAKDNLWGV